MGPQPIFVQDVLVVGAQPIFFSFFLFLAYLFAFSFVEDNEWFRLGYLVMSLRLDDFFLD